MQQGIEFAEVIDEVAFDPDNSELVLIMRTQRTWDDAPQMVEQIKAKVGNYMQFAMGGQMAEAFPDHADSKVRIQLDCKYLPTDIAIPFLEGLNDVLMKGGMRLVVNCTERPQDNPNAG